MIGGDLKRLKNLGVNIKNSIDLRKLALCHNPSIVSEGGTSISNLCKIYLKLNLDKTHQIFDYSTEKLPKSVFEYSALDSIMSRKIGEVLVEIKDRKKSFSINPDCFK